MQKIHIVFVMLLSGLSSLAWGVGSLDTIIIDRGVDEPIRIAVVPFKTDPSLSGEAAMADVIGFDLARSGQFDALASENMLSYPNNRQMVFFRDWRILKATYLVIGNARIVASGEVAVNFELYDVPGERLMLSRRYTVSRSQWRDVAHKISDAVYTEITGVRGAFSTKIMYVLAQNAGSPQAVFSLEIADSDGERSRTLFSSREPILSANWSPDGKRVVYVTFETGRPSIVIQDVEGSYRERLTNFRGLNSAPVFSPDGQSLAMVLSKDGDPEIFIMDLQTRALRQITRHHGIDTEPSWTPDGKHLIFTSDRGGRPQIYQVELATNYLERLTFTGSYNARGQMLPDGRHLVFVHRAEGVFHIAWQDLERDNLQILTQTSLDESPSLAPNGTMLIYATQDQGRGILAVVSIDGSVKYRLPSSSGDVREPAWSPFLED
ncbi:MAG: Tol-Pal system beta propeller repeat protein TolB [Gammaproteobacteria bacterium]|jgi:TolB protein|nr:Tol-Pal system beta propeller repeat protein TolB [Gammaproteobacteria bacterium]